jgi:LysR family hydrogen peroxide-inducible transcriptional activator
VNAHDLTLRQLQYLVAVADTLGFHKAAKACHVSQPSLSAQIAQVESVLGVRLFERDRRRVLVTSAGEDIVARARTVLLAVDDLVSTARRHIDPLEGALRIGVIPTLAPYVLPDFSVALRQRFSKLVVEWREDKTHALVQELEAGKLDAALLAETDETDDLEHAAVAWDAFLLAAAGSHELAHDKGPVKLRDLRAEEVLLLEDGHCLRDQALEVCERARAREGTFRATSLATLSQMVAQGAGVTLLPEVSLGLENRTGALTLRRFGDPEPGRAIALVWRHRSPLAEALGSLARTFRDAWPKTPPRKAAKPRR